MSTKTSVWWHDLLVYCTAESRCQTTYVRSRYCKANFFPYRTRCFKHVLHQEIFFRAPSLPHFHPLRPLPKKGSGCHWWSVKCLLCHQRLWGKNTCTICPGYITWAAKIESVCVILCLKEKISNFLPETISLTEHVDSEAGSTHHLPQTEGGFHFFWI